MFELRQSNVQYFVLNVSIVFVPYIELAFVSKDLLFCCTLYVVSTVIVIINYV